MNEGHAIAVWFRESHADTFTHAQTCEGFDFDGDTYIWVMAFVDLDQDAFFLLDVRTQHEGMPETRDFLFVGIGVTFGKSTPVEWWTDNMIHFSAPHDDHRERLRKGLEWFAGRIEFWTEDHAFASRDIQGGD